jgi:hypothetical protein
VRYACKNTFADERFCVEILSSTKSNGIKATKMSGVILPVKGKQTIKSKPLKIERKYRIARFCTIGINSL